MGKDREYKIAFISLKYIEEKVQEFQTTCKYSCSRNNEIKNFSLFRTYWLFSIGKFKIKFYKRFKTICENCKKTYFLPYKNAKNIFRGGLKPELLLKYSNDKIISSWLINFLANSWMVFGLLLILFLTLVGIRYFTDPIILEEPKLITFEEALISSNQGNIVKLTGLIDYNLAIKKDEIVTTQSGKVEVLSKEIYFPLFSPNDAQKIIATRGGSTDLTNINNKIGIQDLSKLQNQEYTITGRLENIDKITNNDLKLYFLENIPKSKNTDIPRILIDSTNLITLDKFIEKYIQTFVILLICLITSLSLQFYIDKRIANKFKDLKYRFTQSSHQNK